MFSELSLFLTRFAIETNPSWNPPLPFLLMGGVGPSRDTRDAVGGGDTKNFARKGV